MSVNGWDVAVLCLLALLLTTTLYAATAFHDVLIVFSGLLALAGGVVVGFMVKVSEEEKLRSR